MGDVYVEDRVFKGEDYSDQSFTQGEYDNCTFFNCIFSGADLAKVVFVDCQFDSCDLSMANIKGTAFKDVRFRKCKLLGLKFRDCHTFLLSLDFEDCILNYSSFYQLKMPDTRFKDCKLEDVDFAETDLTRTVFTNCDLKGVLFDNTLLERSDLKTSYNLSIDPEVNYIRGAKFSINNIAGLLGKYEIEIE